MSNKEEKPAIAEQVPDEQVATRRTRVMMIHPVEWMSLFTTGLKFAKHTQLIEGVPADAVLIGAAYDIRRDAILLVLESDEYEPVPITKQPPTQLVRIKIGIENATKKKKAARKKK
jgi:hypothetical protein